MKLTRSKMARNCGKLTLLALALSASSLALADDAGWYVGANVGASRATIDDARVTSGLLGSGLTASSIVDDNRSNGYKLFGGYRLNRNIAVEGGYFDLGDFGFKATTVPAGTLNGNIKLRGLNLDLVGMLPITEKFSAFGRIGANYAQARDSFSATGMVKVLDPNPSKRETNLKVGLGVEYAFNDSLAMRAELERYRINDAVGNKGDIDMVSVGLVYRFGAKTPAPAAPVVAPEPVYVAPPPPPPPVVVIQAAPPPPPPAPIKVTLSADSLYSFDKAVIRPAGQQELDRFAADLKGSNFGMISVTGHSDRIGSHAYNLKLSTRRAEAVKDYLVQSGGIAASQIVAQGVDGSDPVTKPGECEGKKVSKALIACLQPDRRVEVEVSGTR